MVRFVLLLLLVVPLFASPARGQEVACAVAGAGEPCACRLAALRPLQGALGVAQAVFGAARIRERPDKEWAALRADPIKVVKGPGGALFITDHHHGADAWRLAGYAEGVCQVQARPGFGSAAEFWAGLEADHLVRLADADGRAITPEQLPPDLASMPDDPYRTLAGHLRRAGGFCRGAVQLEFAEFAWADWLRGRAELPKERVGADALALLPVALALARSPAAAEVPGYAGVGGACP